MSLPAWRGCPSPARHARAGYGHKVPLRGGTRLIRYLSTAELMHELPIMYAVCPSPFQASSTPDLRSPASALAPRNGVAGSRVLPTTRIGGAPAPRSCTWGAGRTGQYAHGRLPHMIACPNMGAARAALAAALCQAGRLRGHGRSMQSTASSAEVRFE